MMLSDLFITVVLLLIIGFAGLYIYNRRKKGNKCIGCPDCGMCSSDCNNRDERDKG